MADLTTKYLGLNLNNPIIIGSSGLTDSVESIKNLEKNGAGAIILKSLFEEEILRETEHLLQMAKKDALLYSQLSETLDFLDIHVKEEKLSKYLQMIREAKKSVFIPIIASINCITSGDWVEFAKKIQDAGADALELNIFILPTDVTSTQAEIETTHFNIIKKVTGLLTIPVSVKISPYYSNLGNFITNLSLSDINGIVLFNRFYSPDFDIENFEIRSASQFSSTDEYTNTLRWIAIMSKKIKKDLSASSGIHSGKTVVKMLLAGAKAIQVVSAVYKNGAEYIQIMLEEIESWMEHKKYNYIDQFSGKMAQEQVKNPAILERMQFMNYFSGIN